MSKSRPETAHPRAFELEQLAFEPEAAAAALRAHVEGCDTCREAVASFGAARSAFLREHPARPVIAAVVERAEAEAREARGRPAWLRALLDRRWLLVPAAAAAAAMFLLVDPRQAPRVGWKGDGAAVLQLYAARDGGAARPIAPAEGLHAGDVLRFGVMAPRGGHAFVASVDEAGTFCRYFPQGEAAALPQNAALQLLPGAIELDATVGREWIVLAVSERPLEEAEVREALLTAWRSRLGDRLGALPLQAATAVVPITKVPP